MRKNQFLNDSCTFLIIVFVVFAFYNCSSNRIVGTYKADAYYSGILYLYEDGLYRFVFPSFGGNKDFVESRGTWKNADSVLFLTSLDSRKIDDYVYVTESNDDSTNSFVRFHFSVNDSLGVKHDSIPPFTIGRIKLSGIDSIYGVKEINGKNILWPKQDRKYWILEDIHGFLPPYYLRDAELDVYRVDYLNSKKFRDKKDRTETFVDEKLVVSKNGDLIFGNGLVFQKKK